MPPGLVRRTFAITNGICTPKVYVIAKFICNYTIKSVLNHRICVPCRYARVNVSQIKHCVLDQCIQYMSVYVELLCIGEQFCFHQNQIKCCFGYFDAMNIFFDNKINDFRGDLTGVRA